MLKLLVMHFGLVVIFFINMVGGWVHPFFQLDLARIVSPNSGDALQGIVSVKGTVTGIGFSYAELSFQNADSEQDTWFLISQVNQIIVDDEITVWDTTMLADGIYNLRVEAVYEDGHRINSVVENLRIRNYTAIETVVNAPNATEQPVLQNIPELDSPTATPKRPTPTPLPPNELALDERTFWQMAVTGGVLGGGGLFVIGFLLLIRRNRRG